MDARDGPGELRHRVLQPEIFRIALIKRQVRGCSAVLSSVQIEVK